MVIALDYDGTYTEDPLLWQMFIRTARIRGHRVICVTARWPSSPVPATCGFDDLVYAPEGDKSTAARRAGYRVDVWIDDMPGTVEPTRILSFDN